MNAKKQLAFLTLSLAAVSILFLYNSPPVSAAGQLQWQTTQTYGGFGTSGPVLIQPDGKVLVAGAKREFPFGSGSGFALTRMLPSGTLDNSFDGDGVVITYFTNAPSSIGALALQPDGKIIAAGAAGFSAAFARYNPDGSLDATFNGTGKFSLGPQSFVSSIAVLPDGKILATGAAGLGAASDFMLIRLNPNGTLDNSFGNGGVGTTPISKQSDQIYSIAVQPDGKIVVAGVADFGSPEGNTFIVVRYNSDGESDPTFDQDGFTITDFGDPNEYATAIALQADGKIVAGGYSWSGVNTRAALVRFNADGSYDNSFGTGGKVVIPAATLTTSRISDLAIQSNGKIVAVGAASSPSASGLLVSRFRRDGSLDTSFDGDGILIMPTTPNWRNLSASSVAIVPNGSIRVTGNETTDKIGIHGFTYSFVGDPQTFVDFDADGKTDLSHLNQFGDSWGWRRSSDNTGDFVLLANDGFTHIVPADYDGDGRTDVAQWSNLNGQWTIINSSNSVMRIVTFGVDDDIPAPADFDGDGKADLTVFRPSTGYWYVANSSDNSFSFIPWGAAGDIPLAGDYNADGLADTAIFRRNASTGFGEWWIQYSFGGNFVTVFGANTDVPVPADYTGDGKMDVAFWRPSDGYWFILRSEDFNYYAAPFGQAGDYLVPGDYDGDGRADIAVFRGSTGLWYLNRSSDGLLFVQFGSTLSRPIPSAYVP